MDKNPIQEIKLWLTGERDYSTGVALLQRYGKNKILAAGLAKFGKERIEQNHRKLVYELGKLVGSSQLVAGSNQKAVRSREPEVRRPEEKPATGNLIADPDEFFPNVNSKPINQYPPIVRRVKYEYAELFRKRSMSHRKMAELPEDNSEPSKQARAALLAEIKNISKRLELLYQHLQAYEATGTMPDENLLWPKPKEQQPDNAERLKLIKKNLQTANGKDRNLLEYQQEKKGNKPAPMPDGPKRKRIEARIKEREKQIAEIEDKLFELEVSK